MFDCSRSAFGQHLVSMHAGETKNTEYEDEENKTGDRAVHATHCRSSKTGCFWGVGRGSHLVPELLVKYHKQLQVLDTVTQTIAYKLQLLGMVRKPGYACVV